MASWEYLEVAAMVPEGCLEETRKDGCVFVCWGPWQAEKDLVAERNLKLSSRLPHHLGFPEGWGVEEVVGWKMRPSTPHHHLCGFSWGGTGAAPHGREPGLARVQLGKERLLMPVRLGASRGRGTVVPLSPAAGIWPRSPP